jgi:hypothetical protein
MHSVNWPVSTMPDEPGAVFADEFAAANAEAVAFAQSCSEGQWTAKVTEEGWSVGVVMHHIAESHASVLRWLEAMVGHHAVTDTSDDIDHRNAAHASRAATIGVGETVALLQENGARTEAFLRGLGEAQLAGTAPFGPAEGLALPVSALAATAARHVREHLGHARQSTAGVS